ncbi:MAG: Hsp20/alpha crystallin family protein [Fibrobacteres bacterium]|nr:Hsp20/alpha crystallin family protein [Fibrobacterota bacterium]
MNNSLVYNPAKWLDQFFNDFDSNGSAKQGFAPAVDVVEDKEEFLLRAELPGVPKENIKVEVKENRLTVSGNKESFHKDTKGEYRYVESSYGAFSRTFELPRNVQGGEIKAEYAHGVLTLRIPKAKEALSRTIEIR